MSTSVCGKFRENSEKYPFLDISWTLDCCYWSSYPYSQWGGGGGGLFSKNWSSGIGIGYQFEVVVSTPLGTRKVELVPGGLVS